MNKNISKRDKNGYEQYVYIVGIKQQNVST